MYDVEPRPYFENEDPLLACREAMNHAKLAKPAPNLVDFLILALNSPSEISNGRGGFVHKW